MKKTILGRICSYIDYNVVALSFWWRWGSSRRCSSDEALQGRWAAHAPS